MNRRKFIATTGGMAGVLSAGRALGSPSRFFGAGAGSVRIESPDGALAAEIFTDASARLGYRLWRGGNSILADSSLGIALDGRDLGAVSELGGGIEDYRVDQRRPTRGGRAEALDRCRGIVIPVAAGGDRPAMRLEVRAYDDAFAWRYLLDAGTAVNVTGESGSFALPSGSQAYFQDNDRNYEAVLRESAIEEVSGVVGAPFTVKLPDEQGYLAISEAALYNFSGMMLRSDSTGELRTVFPDDDSFMVAPGADGVVRSPWRVVLATPDLNGLARSETIRLLNPPPDPELFANADWIRPGRALWSWWSEGTGTFSDQKRYVDAAAALGFEYILVDEGWEFWLGPGKDKWGRVADLCQYASSRGVAVWLWKHYSKLKDEDYRERFLDKVARAGAVGVKIDFMDSESKATVDFYEAALIAAARHKLMVNFHGANKPTGEAMRFPNEMTREGIRGLEYNRAGVNTLPPEHNALIPFTRMLGGHVDYTPVTFDPIKAGATTAAHQLATAAVFISPLTHWADRPERFLDNPAVAPALDAIKGMPTVWDDSIALPASELGQCAAFARRLGDSWIIGVLNASPPRSVGIELEFLERRKYSATILQDGHDFSLSRLDQTLSSDDVIEAELRSGGGLVVALKPASNQD